eukprot:298586_1
MIGYPYYYIGTDAVFFSGVFESYSILNASFDGMVGTCPWSVEDLSNSDDLSYSYPINESIQQYNQIHSRYAEISSQNITMSSITTDTFNSMAMKWTIYRCLIGALASQIFCNQYRSLD